MYTGAKTVLRTVYGNSNGFEVKVSMPRGSALSPLLLVIVIEALSREFRVDLPWELLYADDLVVIAETEDDLIKRHNEWKDFIENRGMKVNTNKTKVMICGEWQKVMQKGSIYKVIKTFMCRGCMIAVTSTGRTSVDIGVNANLEFVDRFCYLGDMLSVDGDADAAVETRSRIHSQS